MRTYYIIVVGILLVVFGMLLYPTLHIVIGGVDLTGFLPLTASATILLPYAFLGFVVYAIVKLSGK